METLNQTYDPMSYQKFQLHKDKNLFEEIIDKLMLEDLPVGFAEQINLLPLHKKRLAILSLLDKDRNLFMKIKSLINKGIGRFDHIKDVILMLRDYVKVGEVEKKKYGEVMTPLELVKEMLNTLPDEVWSNPNLKWLDPANGTGPYPLMVIYKLMKGLSQWEPDEEKRYRHIVENMIYVCELQPKNQFLYMCAVDPWDVYKMNVYTGSFLSEGFDKHMKEVWGLDKFDIVIGNPPYNTDTSGDFQTTDLYDKFTEKSIFLTKRFISFIIPARWMKKNDKIDFRKKIVNFGISNMVYDKNVRYFPNTTISGGITHFLLDNQYKGKTMINNQWIDLRTQIDKFGFLIAEGTDTLQSILHKLQFHPKINNFNSQSYFGIKTNHTIFVEQGLKCYFSDRNGGRRSLKKDENSFYTHIEQNLISDPRSKLGRFKVFTPSAYGYSTKTEDHYHKLGKIFFGYPNEICTESFVFFDFATEIEARNFIIYLNSNFVKFLISLRKIKQHVTSKIFDLVPMIDLTKDISDEYIYNCFGLTQDEIKLIHNF
jgi:site-specific DNA-methyltransferase (adenine-specific)